VGTQTNQLTVSCLLAPIQFDLTPVFLFFSTYCFDYIVLKAIFVDIQVIGYL
jgi:hypothetical protein